MRKFILGSFTIICFNLNEAEAQQIDSIACRKFEDTLNVIRKYILECDPDFQLRRVNAANFLYRITNIPTTSTISFIGPENPKFSDYKKWVGWYEKNKGHLKFDAEKNEIVVFGNVSD